MEALKTRLRDRIKAAKFTEHGVYVNNEEMTALLDELEGLEKKAESLDILLRCALRRILLP